MPPSERATLYDGRSATAWDVTVRVGDDAITVTRADGGTEEVAARLLSRGRDGVGDRVVVRRRDMADWRLLFDQPAAWITALPRADATTSRVASRYAAAVAVTIGVVALVWWQGGVMLEAAAPLVPHSLAARVGDAVVGQLGADETCGNAAGLAALARLNARLALPDGATVTVARGPTVNAFAAPGGRVVLFDGLLQQARGPDEIAGVLAHELAHVRLHHPEQAMLRYFGVSIAASAVGGNVGSAADLALVLSNTRGKEADADSEGVATLQAAGIAPAALADLLVRLDAARARDSKAQTRIGRAIDRLSDYAATHPEGAARAAAIRGGVPTRGAGPALSPRDWAALRRICAPATPPLPRPAA